ncbi:hypothetical protein [Runella zeae]|uniref:hypothetical protein n=1 Tax=Runella zeae TaxID=94255 RepID=UPI00041E1016|nr:hypothetical protein [Runella zeae]
MNKTEFVINSLNGGNGDIWMRLVGFYTASYLMPSLKLKIIIPPHLLGVASVFSDRLCLVEKLTEKPDVTYTSLGLKDLLPSILRGNKFVSPYQKMIFEQKKNKKIKDYVNRFFFEISNMLGVVQMPSLKHTECYQGYLDIIGIFLLNKISYSDFVKQLEVDFLLIWERLNLFNKLSDDLWVPDSLNNSCIIFPTGTSRQFMPVWWAKKNFPDAYYAFYINDVDAKKYSNAGLKLCFYKRPEDIIVYSKIAQNVISTDSFPSHLLQFSILNSIILLTESRKNKIVAPCFKGVIVESEAQCHPCLHLDRSNHPKCEAGYTECLNWKNSVYTERIVENFY